MVPNKSNWDQKRFKDLVKLDRGSSPRPIVDYITDSEDGVNWIKIGDTKDSTLFINSTNQKITKEGAKKSRKVSKGEIILSNSMSYGKPYILNIDGFIHDGWFVIRNYEDSFDKDYLLQYLGSEVIQNQYKRLAAGGVVSNISSDLVYSVRAVVPPLLEQQKIAKILSTWDKAISTTERLIDNSTQQKKALMQQLLTGKKRLLDDEGNRFEGEWEEVKLSAVAQIIMGSSPKSESYNEVGDGLPLLQGNADIKNRKSVPRIYTSQITKECQVDDILFSVRAPVGTVAVSKHHACIGRGIAAIKAKKNHSQDYLYQWLLSFELKWERYSQGSTFEAVNSNDIKSLNLSVPSFKEQQKIATVLTNADKEIELFEQQLADLQQEKKALMQVLLMGKKRVLVNEAVA